MTKNTSYHYSIIIPHKNTPRLLERCLYSIPTWDEIQIIIIDDNSNSVSVFYIFKKTLFAVCRYPGVYFGAM
ncbi:glycosyltransferase, partial [Phocaeicola vulgatus]|uniref:glycosyltransferase n=1 Tax=Phocaeicola vulgatus TaxID=821 RepID=UPI0039B5CC33